jgi:hypothetical protein
MVWRPHVAFAVLLRLLHTTITWNIRTQPKRLYFVLMTTVKDTGTGNAGSLHTTTLAEDQTIDDKINAPNPQGKKVRLWSRKKIVDKKGEKNDEATAVKETFPPVPLLQLYRFSTRFEILLNIVGLFCGICSGAAQVSPFSAEIHGPADLLPLKALDDVDIRGPDSCFCQFRESYPGSSAEK